MRLIIALIFLLTALSAHNLRASELIPLDKFISENGTEDKANAVYVFLRCASQLTYVSMLMEGRDPNKANMLLARSEQLLAVASEFKAELSNVSIEHAMSLNLTAVQKLMKYHTDSGNNNYLKTGSYFSEADWSNIQICSRLVGASAE